MPCPWDWPSPYRALRPLLFGLPAENAHRFTEEMLAAAQHLPFVLERLRAQSEVRDARLAQDLLGLRFANPVGLAAGMDKGARAVRAWGALGFGHVEIGGVTPRPQPGNPRPRLFRHPQAASLQNAMGFNNPGMDTVRARLARVYPQPFPIGVNLGKNKDTPLAQAAEDYLAVARKLGGVCDYFVMNVSSPNTPGLRDLQSADFLSAAVDALKRATPRPVLIKIAPDLTPEAALALCEQACEAGAEGIIATNTTIDYALLPGAQPQGGLSGAVLREKSYRLLQVLGRALHGRTLLISAGGIDSAEEAYRRLRAGAHLVQIYTALVYQGPGLVRQINEGLLRLLTRDGFAHLAEAVGADWR